MKRKTKQKKNEHKRIQYTLNIVLYEDIFKKYSEIEPEKLVSEVKNGEQRVEKKNNNNMKQRATVIRLFNGMTKLKCGF